MSDSEREVVKQRRRALIKAAGAAPVVFSLANGSAVAAASLTCADKSAALAISPGNPDPVGGVEGAPDTWVRRQVQMLKFAPSPNANSTTFGFQWGGNYYLVTGTSASLYTMPSNYSAYAVSGSYYYLIVDYVSGGLYGVYPQDTNITNPIAGASCWNSLNPNGPTATPGTNVIS